MVRFTMQEDTATRSSPHTRGDGPLRSTVSAVCLPFSPHAWGWSALAGCLAIRTRVLPTRVGMVRPATWTDANGVCSPHTRGDGPLPSAPTLRVRRFSPHAWGWSGHGAAAGLNNVVLPTRVGMVRIRATCRRSGASSPHTRGDGPFRQATDVIIPAFSPHAWGWSAWSLPPLKGPAVLPTRVGMVRKTEAKF